MKNTIIVTVFAILFTIFGIQKVQSQYRQYKPLRHRSYQKESIHLYRYSPIIRSGYTSCCTEEAPFNYKITYNNMAGLLAMQNAINAARQKEVEEWLKKQENNFKDDINSQLGSNYSNFRDAQKAFFKNYEENVLKINNSIEYVASSHSKKSKALNEEQKQHTKDLLTLEKWQRLKVWCERNNSSVCTELPNTRVRDRELRSVNLGTLNSLKNNTLKDFNRTEYESALYKSWAQGVYILNDNNALTTEMVNKRISHYNKKGLEDKVFLMTAYLTQYNNRNSGPLAVPPSQWQIPPLWDNNTLLERGKKKASPVPMDARVFEPGFDSDCQRAEPTSPRDGIRRPNNCNSINAIRERVIQEHMDEILYKVDDSKLTGKAKCVYGKLKSINGNLFKKTIGKFINDPKYNLVIQNGDCKDTNTACTDGNSIGTTGNVYITIENNHLLDIDMAATILHEGIHAELWRYVDQYKKGINPNDKKEIFRYYKHYAEKYGDVFDNNENNAKNAIDHIYMTQYYIIPVATALRELDKKSYPLDYYKSYAWDGLRAWDPNNTLKMEEDNKYYGYRKIVDANSKICK